MMKHIAMPWFDTPATDYLDHPPRLEEAPMPPVLMHVTGILAMFLLCFLVWAAFTSVDEIASASGQIIPSGYIQSVQHPEGGIITEILVEDGDLVEKGQVLMRMDATAAMADLGQIKARQHALRLQASRLSQFATGTMQDPLTADEAEILQSMEAARTSQRNILETQITQKMQELKALHAARTALKKDAGLVEKQYAMHRELAEKGIGSRLMAIESERQRNQIRAQLAETDIQAARAEEAIAEAHNRLESLDAELKQDAMTRHGQLRAELEEVSKTLEKLAATAERTVVVSPVRGLVKGLSIYTLGGVAEPGKVLMEIVPVEKELIVEAMVAPKDVGHLRQGQEVKVKVSAFDFARHGNVPGRLRSVSASSFPNEEGESFYKIKVGLERGYVGRDPGRNIILPGMTVQADIITGKKTILDYLLKPIHLAKESAFSEN